MLLNTGTSEIPWTRWAKAQDYERAFWQRLGDGISAGTREQLDWYEWRVGELRRRLGAAGRSAALDGRVLEIGSGPVGMVNFLEGPERYAVDPLEGFYRTQPSLVELRRRGVAYLEGTGERLGFEDGSCALVIIDNVIDHTYAPAAILREIRRVLRPDGCLYLSVNVHTAWGARLHALLAFLRIDEGHPYTFTSRTLRRLLAQGGFRVLAEEIADYAEARRADLRSASLRDRVKGATGLSEFSHSVVCAREADAAVSRR
jgi:SAM-dependent methyltransferase